MPRHKPTTQYANELAGKDFAICVSGKLNNPATDFDRELYKFIADRAASRVTAQQGMQSGTAYVHGKPIYWLYSWELPITAETRPPLLFVTDDETERQKFITKAKE